MAKIVEPQVFLIAETSIVRSLTEHGMHGFMKAIGAPDWSTHRSERREELAEVAGKSCYMSFNVEGNKNLTRTGTRPNSDYLQEQIIKTKHGSVLEHATVTLAFVNVSRVFTHELVRHRAGAAYSQVSGRFVRTDEINYFLPSCIKENPAAVRRFQLAYEAMEAWCEHLGELFDINNMKDFTLKKTLTSAFRRLIGNGQANHIIATFNHRALRNIIELRTHESAEEEIRIAFLKVFDLVRARYPAFYLDAIEHELVAGHRKVRFTYQKV
jgi:thymidylate synthase (FAD)